MSSDRRHKNKNIKKEYELEYVAEDVGNHITNLRTAAKMTRYQLALCTGLKESVIMRIEKGICEPKLNTLFRIINGLDMKPADFWKVFN
ncbi:MAG: helix-turn-helix domain-containing protein [Candidatus Margulisbacteria bacterium]|jgi:transcriptional regulator with XRE-family HTH domain|nr:helix-turn-helix domain-containing protein [Candidatus Margulisiibacteriota bacterium]